MGMITAQRAYDDIVAQIDHEGSPYGDWYVGIAFDARTRLFVEHAVSEQAGWWIIRDCPSEAAARSVETALLKLGCDGAPGGGDSSTTQVYAYLKTHLTNP